VFGPDILQEVEKQVRMVRENLRVVQCRQKRVDLLSWRFCVPQGVTYERFSLFQGTRKLAPRFIRPFKIMEKRGEVAYRLELLPQLSDVHDVFHVSQLKKCLHVTK
jgi:hypothetical protein